LPKDVVAEALKDYIPSVKSKPVLVWLEEKSVWELWYVWSDNEDDDTMTCSEQPSEGDGLTECRTFSDVADIEGNIIYPKIVAYALSKRRT
jgi:hypothetical protein